MSTYELRRRSLNRRRFAALGAATLAAPALLRHGRSVSAQDEKPGTIKLDYAYYSPTSLVLRRFAWLEEELGAEDIKIEWTLSAGSNKANEYLRSDAIDFGSTAGAAALLARANGSNIRTVYVYSKPEWTALVAPAGSEITTVEQLAGKKVAATKGTDPYFFLLRSLDQAGLTGTDAEVINLQHADGKNALERGDVDAWSGLDPHMAQTEIEQGSVLFYRNIDFNSFGFLNARQSFLDDYPTYVPRILAAYERARQWVLDTPDEAAQILAEEASLSFEVAQKELVERTVLTHDPVPGNADHIAVLTAIIPIFEAENQLTPGADVNKALEELFAPEAIQSVVTPA